MTKKFFTDESLSTFVDEIKVYTDDAISAKHFAVNVTGSGTDSSPYVSDKTYATMRLAIDEGANVVLRFAGFTFYPMELAHTHVRFTYQQLHGGDSITAIDFVFNSDDSLSALSYTMPAESMVDSKLESKANTSHTHSIENITNLQNTLDGKASSSHTHSAATTSANGFMSSSDKSKLDGIATGANKTTVDSSLSTTSANPVQNKTISRLNSTLIPIGTSVPSNADLNTLNYIKVGNYYCSTNASAKTLTNCPVEKAFMMQVYSPLSTVIDNESTSSWVYRLRRLTTLEGDIYQQFVSSSSTAGTFTYGSWKKVAPVTLNDLNVTATAAELNKLDGVTATTTELNYVDGVTSNIQTQLDGKVSNTRTVNGKPLSANVTLSASDVGADPANSASAALAEAKVYADNAATVVKNDLLNGAGAAYDTLKELGELIDDNADAIDALETIAAGKMDKTNPTGTGSFSMNRKAGTTVGARSFAQGYNATASGTESMSIGYENSATATGAFASGGGTTASGAYSYTGGRNATASGDSSWAFGNATVASGIEAHAEGRRTQATGNYGSHAEGMETYAKGYCSHTEGYNTTAVEGTWNAHAEGQSTSAGGDNSHAEGDGTIANSLAQHVQGQYNIADPGATSADVRGTYAHIVGNGTDADNRSNAHTLDWNGNAWYAGDLTVEGTIHGKATKDGSGNIITSTYETKTDANSKIADIQTELDAIKADPRYFLTTYTYDWNNSSDTYEYTIGDHTFAEQKAAYQDGKILLCYYEDWGTMCQMAYMEEEMITYSSYAIDDVWLMCASMNVTSEESRYYVFDKKLSEFNEGPYFLVTYTFTNDSSVPPTSNFTYAQIKAAYDEGKIPIAVTEYTSSSTSGISLLKMSDINPICFRKIYSPMDDYLLYSEIVHTSEDVISSISRTFVTTTDNALNSISKRPVQNKVVKTALDEKLPITTKYAASSSVGGAASSLAGFRNATNQSVAPDSFTTNGIGYVTGVSSVFGKNDGAMYAQAYSSDWITQILHDYYTGQIAVRAKNSSGWTVWRKVLDSVNYTTYVDTRIDEKLGVIENASY